MNWTDEDVVQACVAWRADDNGPRDGVIDRAMRRVMTRAVELAAARGGTMAQEEIAQLRTDLGQGEYWGMKRQAALLDSHTAQSATVATLQAKVGRLARDVDDYRTAAETAGAHRDELLARVAEVTTRLREYHGEQDGDDISHDDANDGVTGIVAWVKAYKERFRETREGIFDTGFRCVSEGGETFYLDPEELEALQDERDALRAEVEELEVLNRRWQSATGCGEPGLVLSRAAELRAEVERLKAENQRLSAVESRLAAIRERAENKVEVGHRLRMLMLSEPGRAWSSYRYEDCAASFARWVMEGDALNHSMPSNGSSDAPQESPRYEGHLNPWEGMVEHKSTPSKPSNCSAAPQQAKSSHDVHGHKGPYPCSPTCTHDDAAAPGHAERVKEKSKAFQNAAMSIRDPRVLGTERRGDVTMVKITPSLMNERELREYERGKEDGAEAMRAACLEIVQDEKDEIGLVGYQCERLKAAIEGATP